MVDKIIIYQTIHGKNPCYKSDRRISGSIGELIHDTASNETHVARYTDASKWLEEKGYFVRKYNNHWNKITVRKEVHFFGGMNARSDQFVFAQHLLLDMACWGCAGSYNKNPLARIQCETCQDGKKDKEYYELAMENVAALFAWLIQTGVCNRPVSDIVDHRTAHKMGGANNHGDIWDWCSAQGESYKTYMDGFRARVQRYLDRGPVVVEWHYSTAGMPACQQSKRYNPVARYMQICLNRLGYTCEVDGLLWNETIVQLKKFQAEWNLLTDGVCGLETWSAIEDAMNGGKPAVVVAPIVQHYTGTVKTSKGKGISLWKSPNQVGRRCKVPDGATVEVTSDCITGIARKTMAPAKYGVYNGYVDTQYLVNRADIK